MSQRGGCSLSMLDRQDVIDEVRGLKRYHEVEYEGFVYDDPDNPMKDYDWCERYVKLEDVLKVLGGQHEQLLPLR